MNNTNIKNIDIVNEYIKRLCREDYVFNRKSIFGIYRSYIVYDLSDDGLKNKDYIEELIRTNNKQLFDSHYSDNYTLINHFIHYVKDDRSNILNYVDKAINSKDKDFIEKNKYINNIIEDIRKCSEDYIRKRHVLFRNIKYEKIVFENTIDIAIFTIKYISNNSSINIDMYSLKLIIEYIINEQRGRLKLINYSIILQLGSNREAEMRIYKELRYGKESYKVDINEREMKTREPAEIMYKYQWDSK